MAIEDLFYLADKAIDEGNIEDAHRMLEDILMDEPNYGRAHNHLGWLYRYKFSDHAKAERHYKLAIKFSPEYTASYLNFGYLLRDQNRLEEYRQLIEDARKANGLSNAAFFEELGTYYELVQNYPHAIDSYMQSISHSMNDGNIEELKKSINRCMGKQKLFSASRLVRAFRVLIGKE
jgi:Tfp pilus assembly protein PilF